MPLTLDTSRQFRSMRQLGDLVNAISLAPTSESEPDWLEWKREADLTDRRWHALIAKCLAGFANRDPISAQLWAGGCAYMVIGVEPDNVHGISPVDNADLGAGISRYVRDTVRWSPQYIQHNGKPVLVITIEPPEYGDQIVAMLNSYQPQQRGAGVCRKGDVFIRRHGRTDHAVQEDYDMLVRRFGANEARVNGITIQALGTATAICTSCSSDVVDLWCARVEHEYLEPLETSTRDSNTPSILRSIMDRRPDEYREQVAAYLAQMTPLLPSVVRAMALQSLPPGMRLIVKNETERNFVGVRVEVFIEGDVWAYQNAEDALPETPTRPRKWGLTTNLFPSPMIPNISTPRVMPHLFGPGIDNSGSARIKFDDVDLRPFGEVELDPIHLVADAELAGETITATWSATSSSAMGVAQGEFRVKVSSEIRSLQIEKRGH